MSTMTPSRQRNAWLVMVGVGMSVSLTPTTTPRSLRSNATVPGPPSVPRSVVVTPATGVQRPAGAEVDAEAGAAPGHATPAVSVTPSAIFAAICECCRNRFIVAPLRPHVDFGLRPSSIPGIRPRRPAADGTERAGPHRPGAVGCRLAAVAGAAGPRGD